jgi:hypothetical protein
LARVGSRLAGGDRKRKVKPENPPAGPQPHQAGSAARQDGARHRRDK